MCCSVKQGLPLLLDLFVPVGLLVLQVCLHAAEGSWQGVAGGPGAGLEQAIQVLL
jgi:hypothetical protein